MKFMNKNSLRKFSLYCLIIGVMIFIISFFMFHFVTDEGIVSEFQKEAGKPFVTNMVATLGVLYIFASSISFLASFIFFKKD